MVKEQIHPCLRAVIVQVQAFGYGKDLFRLLCRYQGNLLQQSIRRGHHIDNCPADPAHHGIKDRLGIHGFAGIRKDDIVLPLQFDMNIHIRMDHGPDQLLRLK